jgi:hypothetical protein
MTPMRALPCSLLLLLSGCMVPEAWVDLDLESTAFVNHWILEGEATRVTLMADGYECPDGRTARVDLLRPTGFDGPRPLALLLHDGAYDWLDAADNAYETGRTRLGALYADDQVASTLGTDGDEVDGNARGAWPASLLRAGYAVAVPGNCYGDLWHGRGGNDLQLEGFLRNGARLASDAIHLAQAQSDVSDQRLLGIGLGDGGRGVTELALDGVVFDAVVVDASPDWLSPTVQRPAYFQRYITGLQRIWHSELPDVSDPAVTVQDELDALQALLQRDTLVHLVSDLGWRTPIIYAWSSTDELVDADQARPAAETIAARYPDGEHRVLDWQEAAHAPSNTERGFETVQGFMVWVGDLLGEFVYVPPAEEPVP